MQITVSSLRALSALLLFPALPSLLRNQSALSAAAFRLLDERARFAGASPESRELLTALFKVVAALVRDCSLSACELRLLLDLLHLELQAMRAATDGNTFRVASAFSLLLSLIHI